MGLIGSIWTLPLSAGNIKRNDAGSRCWRERSPAPAR